MKPTGWKRKMRLYHQMVPHKASSLEEMTQSHRQEDSTSSEGKRSHNSLILSKYLSFKRRRKQSKSLSLCFACGKPVSLVLFKQELSMMVEELKEG